MASQKDDFQLKWLSGKPLKPSRTQKVKSWTDGLESEFKKPELPQGRTWVKVTGVTEYAEAFKSIIGSQYGKPFSKTYAAILRAETGNPHDKDAVQVYVDNILIGYLERGSTWRFRRADAAGLVKDGELRTVVQIEGDGEFRQGRRLVYWARADLSPAQSMSTQSINNLTNQKLPKKILMMFGVLCVALVLIKLLLP